MSTPASRLPDHPSLEQLRKQARELLRLLHAGDDAAAQRLVTARAGSSPSDAQLADAQFVLAREYGFDSWPKLVHHFETLPPPALARFEALATRLADAYTAADAQAIRQINWDNGTSFRWDREPERMRQRVATWFASSDRTIDLALADTRQQVASHAGHDSWTDLIAALVQPAANRHPTPAGAPNYRIDLDEDSITVEGPLTGRDWDAVLDAVRQHRLTSVEAGGQMTDASLRRLTQIDHIVRLDLGGSNGVTDEGLRELAHLPRLESLAVGGWQSPITDRGLEVLQQLTALRAFAMGWHQRVTDAGLVHLSACAHLEQVNLMGTPTGDGAVEACAGKAALRELRLGTRVTARGLAALHRCPKFASWQGGEVVVDLMGAPAGPTLLLLPQRPFAHGGLDALTGLDGLANLTFFTMGDSGGATMSAAALGPLATLPHLAVLGCDPTDEGLRAIAGLPALRKLTIQDTQATDEGFVALSGSPTLEYLWSPGCRNLGDRGFAALSALPALRGLSVSVRRVSDEALALLPRFPALREVMPAGATDAGFRHIGRCEALEALWCMYCAETGDAATTHIAHLPALRTYYAGSTQISDASLETLGTIETLEDVSLWDCLRVTGAGISALARLPRLRRLTLEGLPGVTRASLTVFRPDVRVRMGW